MRLGWLRMRAGRVAGANRPAAWRGGRRRVSLSILTQAFVALACMALLVMEGQHAWQTRASRLREMQTANASLARSLVQQAEDTIAIADTILISLANQFEREGALPEALADIEHQMVAQTVASPRISGLFLLGTDGQWLATSLPAVPPGLNYAGREYFQRHRTDPDRSAYFGHPVRSLSRGIWIFNVSRRLEHPDGSFAGVVTATLDAEQFSRQYSDIGVGAHGSIALLRSDGTLVTRHPFDAAQVGRNYGASEFFRLILPRDRSGSYHSASPLDGIEKVGGYDSGRRYPVVVMVLSAVTDVLVGWQAETVWRLAGTGLIVALLAWLGSRLARQFRRRQEMERALGESEMHFRMLTEMSGDMVTQVALDGRRTYVSPASLQLLGWAPEELVGTRALGAAHPDDVAETDGVLAAISTGTAEDVTVAYRARRRDGSEVWIEANVRITRDPDTGQASGAVMISRDITARKLLEDQLATLATMDGLTSLANRRRLDEALVTEWRRAVREGTELSVAMMDVDRFKAFNDRYGHQVGDECLRDVAAALACAARRPPDLVARYGGEELLALLPSTPEQGAAEVGEKMRAAVEALGIPHAGSPPAGVVTVSVGVATAMPMADVDATSGIHALLAAADEALYRAKSGGRNCVAVAAATHKRDWTGFGVELRVIAVD